MAEAVLAVQVDPDYRVELKRTSTPVALRPMSVHGTVSTRLGGPVTVTLQRRAESGVWRTLRSQRLRAENQFALTWTPPRPGREWLRLRATWAEGVTDVTVAYRAQVEARFAPLVEPVRRDDVPHTWRPGCPVGPAGLRQIHMSYWDYQGRLRRGTLIGAAWVVSDYLAIFRRAFDTGFPIKKMYPADRYGGVDERAMRAGNTSAFNCRHVTGNPYRMSQHSYGNAIDINTFENPYVTGSPGLPAEGGGALLPPTRAQPARPWRHHPSVLHRPRAVAPGWSWGARWSFPDYQHWSSNGG